MKKVPDRWKKVCNLVFKIFAWILGIVLVPVVVTILLLLCLWRNVILVLVVKCLKPKLLSILNCRDGLYAVDRFWEDSRSSLGLIAILNGNVCIDKFRDEFTKKVLEIPKSLEENIFARLTQIPTSFGGYYFWQKANYFLIHEHIRQIDQPIDEAGLKKFAGTLMTLPFPNKRPLWEILVFPSFNTNCSAVVIRIHQAVTDPEGLMDLVASLSSGMIKESSRSQLQEVMLGDKSTTSEKVREALKMPGSTVRFCASIFDSSKASFDSSLDGGDGVASWNEMHELSFHKIQKSQNLKFSSTVGISLFSAAIADHIRSLSSETRHDLDLESGIKKSDEGQGPGSDNMTIIFPVQSSKKVQERLTNSQGFTIIKTDQCGNPISRLKKIDTQIKSALENKHSTVSNSLLNILSLLPRHLLRYVTSQFLFGGSFIFQEFRSEITTVSAAEGSESAQAALDLIFIGEYELLELIPLSGLQWSHTAISVATIKFQEKVTMSLIVNSGLLKSTEKQKVVDELVLNLPDELDKIFEDGQDEHGFISIPII